MSETTATVTQILGPELSADAARILAAAARLPEGERDARPIAWARERATGKPLAYVIGSEVFFGLEFLAEPGVIVPRADSEPTVRLALRRLAAVAPVGARDAGPLVVDHCSGSGNVACAIAHHRSDARVVSCDLMAACTSLARRNVERLGLAARVTCATGDLFGALAPELEGTLDLVVASPPFISTGRLAKDRAYLLEHEPREAFDAGPYGLSIHQRLVKAAATWLRPGGALVLEFGEGQLEQMKRLYDRAGCYGEVETEADEAGVVRAIGATKRA